VSSAPKAPTCQAEPGWPGCRAKANAACTGGAANPVADSLAAVRASQRKRSLLIAGADEWLVRMLNAQAFL
jgi:hypothetical protein